VSRTQRELKALRQQQREEAAARQRARDRRNLFIIGGILGTAAVAILIVALALNHAAQVSTQNRLPFQTVSGTVGQAVADEGRNHVDPSTAPTYKFYPPASGPHFSVQGVAPVPWQTIDTLQEGQYIHNLEHGGIVIDHNAISGDDLAKLTSLLSTYPRDKYGEVKIVIQPYDRIAPGTIVLTAWGWRQILTRYDETVVRAFLDAHMNRCCEDVP